jgi:hypothetical protein
MKLSDLTKEQLAEVGRVHPDLVADRELSKELDGGRTKVQSDSTSARAHGPAPKRTDGYRSKAEADYAAWLDAQPDVKRWNYEPLSIALQGKGTRFRPDFVATWRKGAPFFASGPWKVAVEVKGTSKGQPWWRGDSRSHALHGAAALDEVLGLMLFVAWKVKGEWFHERVCVRS